VINADTTFYAQWQINSYKITFDSNGGTGVASKNIAAGVAIGELPSTSRDGYTFTGWYTAGSGGTKIGADTVINVDTTFYAQWQINSYKVTFNANKGKISGKTTLTKNLEYDVTIGKLPAPKRTGYKFKGWYTKKSGGAKIASATKMPANNVTYYAQWQINKYKVTFNANKGKVSGKAKLVKSVKYKSKLGKLSTPKRAGYKFKGWYTKKSGGKKITSSTKMSAKNVTCYARWKKR
jgi:uncharacterized repeat protein (TIGR02543 family)